MQKSTFQPCLYIDQAPRHQCTSSAWQVRIVYMAGLHITVENMRASLVPAKHVYVLSHSCAQQLMRLRTANQRPS